MSWLAKFIPSSGKASTLSMGAAGADPAVRWVRINENPQHPLIALFESRAFANAKAQALGAPWVALSYACGYVLSDGWHFRDANGLIPTFCPVPPDALVAMQQLVISLQQEKMSGKELARRVGTVLGDLPALAALSKPQFADICNCTLMRVCYPAPIGAKDDWLTMPPWALKLPRRRVQLM